MPLIRHLEIARYKTTKDANEKLSKLSQASGWPDHVISRLAISRSLMVSAIPDPVTADRKGKELRGETLFHSKHDTDYLPWVTAMICQHLGRSYRDDDEAIDLVISHLHRGIDFLHSDFEQEVDFMKMILALARKVSESSIQGPRTEPSLRTSLIPTAGRILPIELTIGTTAKSKEKINIVVNDTKKYSNCHFALSGMSGSGKTQLALQLLSSMMACCDETTGVLFIDYAKGDVGNNESFAKAIKANVLRLPSDPLPIGAFHLQDYSDDVIKLAAEDKREVYKNLYRLGAKQQGRLATAIRESYEELQKSKEQAPDFNYIDEKLSEIYRRESQQPDSLTEIFRQLTTVKLFWSRGEQTPPHPLHTNRWIVDVHELSGLKDIVAFTLIEQLYREMRSLPDSKIDSQTGLRHIRCVIVIDEAQNYLRAQNRFLQAIIREGRSKGFAVMLMCQSPTDYNQPDFDYTEQLQFTYMLRSKTDAKSVQRLLGIPGDEAKRIADELGKVENLFGFGLVSGKVEKFRLASFYEHYAS